MNTNLYYMPKIFKDLIAFKISSKIARVQPVISNFFAHNLVRYYLIKA